jgi:hypothetical protein
MLKIYVWIMVIPGRDIFIFMLFATLEKWRKKAQSKSPFSRLPMKFNGEKFEIINSVWMNFEFNIKWQSAICNWKPPTAVWSVQLETKLKQHSSQKVRSGFWLECLFGNISYT